MQTRLSPHERGESYSLKRKLTVDSQTYYDFADIVVNESREEFGPPDKQGLVKSSSRKRKQYRLKYDGQRYVVPAELSAISR